MTDTTDTKDFRWAAADCVMRKSMAALEKLQSQQNLVQTGTVGVAEQSAARPLDDALLLETQRAMEMAREALSDFPNQDQ